MQKLPILMDSHFYSYCDSSKEAENIPFYDISSYFFQVDSHVREYKLIE